MVPRKKKATAKGSSASTMATTAMRFNADKPQLSYVLDFPNAIREFANVCEFGAEKYARHNWKKGMPTSKMLDSLMRHLSAHAAGETLDAETGLPHMAHVMWNAAAMVEFIETHPELDDRFGFGDGSHDV